MRQTDHKQEGEPAEAEDAEDVAEAADIKEEELRLARTEPQPVSQFSRATQLE